MEDPHLQARDYFQVVTHPDAGTYPMSGPIWSFLDYDRSKVLNENEGEPMSNRREKRHEHAPMLGEHNDEILAEAGFDASQISQLREKGVIGAKAVAATPAQAD